MAYVSTTTTTLLDRVAAVGRATGEILMMLVTAQPRIAAIERLGRMSDDDLTARGTTRQIELRRILGPGAAL